MTAIDGSPLAPAQVGVKRLPTDSLHPNPYNPRRLFDKEPFETLKASIAKVGILVPLTVYWEAARENYVILDGQRRWMCAKQLGLLEVPANQVGEPTLVQNIVTMFQIHKLREDWELMPTALTLGVLMGELKETRVKALATLTGLDQAVVVRCRKLLSYPKRYQDMMLDPDPAKRVKADFFIELYAVISDRNVRRLHWFQRNQFTQQMLGKYSAKGIRAVTDFRVVKQHINNAVKAGQVREIGRRLKQFAEAPKLGVEHLQIPLAGQRAEVRSLLMVIEKLRAHLEVLSVEKVYGEEQLWGELEKLMKLISSKIREADRRIR